MDKWKYKEQLDSKWENSLKIGVTPIDEMMSENRLTWFGHVQKRLINAIVRKNELI
jgi:hypothetical protein